MAIPFIRPMSLFVSLARNDVELARAAVDGGADALKVHVNVGHRASGNAFGSVAEEAPAITAIQELGVPVGLVVGGEDRVTLDEVRAARELGVDFFDVYAHHAPAWYVDEAPADGAMVALGHGEPWERASVLEQLGFAALEASLAPGEAYGSPLRADRLADLACLAARTSLPVVMPSQHRLAPEDVPALRRAGADAVLIGVVVTGDEPDHVRTATASFRDAIDALPAE